jgi:hypothetical protein
MLTKQDRNSIITLWEQTLQLPAKGVYQTYTKKARMDAIQSTLNVLGLKIEISAEGWVIRPSKRVK